MSQPSFHPFRSPEAKAEYLALYDLREKKWPVPFECRMVDTSWGQTFVRVSGPTEAPPLVLLPGAAVSSLMWCWSIASLSTDHRTYAVDSIYDVGRSVFTRPIKRLADYISWIDQLLTALRLGDRVSLMGMSYGGWLAANYAIEFPDRLAHTVLVAPAATLLPVRWQFYARGIPSAFHPSLARHFMHWICQDAVRKSDELRQTVDEMISDSRVAMRCYRGKLGVFPSAMSDDELRRLPSSTLVLLGDSEKLYSPHRAMQRLRQLAPRVTTEIIPESGHDLPLVQAEAMSGKVLEFLGR